MSTTTDTFARFVDVLAETLDDHDTSGQALASRLHLSRFHFDRLVTAASGEPPATLRRRILLERAAYRLITTDDELLPVALDAGYASHEAFTRAFRRAFGQAPSRWRSRPSQFRIDAPSKVHFNPPGGLRIPAQRKVTTMELLTRMVEHNIWLVGEMIARARELREEVLDAPIERVFAAEEGAAHIAFSVSALSGGLLVQLVGARGAFAVATAFGVAAAVIAAAGQAARAAQT